MLLVELGELTLCLRLVVAVVCFCVVAGRSREVILTSVRTRQSQAAGTIFSLLSVSSDTVYILTEHSDV